MRRYGSCRTLRELQILWEVLSDIRPTIYTFHPDPNLAHIKYYHTTKAEKDIQIGVLWLVTVKNYIQISTSDCGKPIVEHFDSFQQFGLSRMRMLALIEWQGHYRATWTILTKNVCYVGNSHVGAWTSMPIQTPGCPLKTMCLVFTQ